MKKFLSAIIVLSMVCLLSAPAFAASDSWKADAAGNWVDAGSWTLGGVVPGTGDTATFAFTLTADRIVTVDADRAISTITFGNTSAFKYTLNGGNLLLDNGGVIQTAAANGAHTDTISSAIAIQGVGGTATFTGGATAATGLMSIGAVTGVSTAGNTTTLTLNGTNTGSNAITGVIGNGAAGGTLAVTKSGTGTWTLSGVNTYTGGTTLTAGNLNINSTTALGGATSRLTINGGTIDNTSAGDITLANNNPQTWNSDFTYTGGTRSLNLGTGAVTLGATPTVTVSGNTLTVGGIISGAFGLTKAGAGILTLSGGNNYTGATTINAGTLKLGASGVITDTSALTVATGATLDLNGKGEAVASLAGGGTVTNNGAINSLEVCGNNTSTTFSGIIQDGTGTTQLTKSGTGTLTLTGANTYTGITDIRGGTLRVSNASALGAGAGANVFHTGTFWGTPTTLDIGSTTLLIGGTYTQDGTATLMVDVNGTVHGSIVAAGAATVTAADRLVLNVSNYVPNNTTYTIIDGAAGGAIVAPAITDNSALLTFAATTVGNDLILTATRTNSYTKVATTGNASAAGSVLEAIGTAGATGDMLTILNELDNMATSAEIDRALDTVVPVVDSGVTSASNTAITQFIGTSMARLGEMFAQARGAETGETGVSTGSQGLKGFEAWGQGFGEYVHQKPRGLSNGYHATIWGTALGADIPAFNEKVRLGLSGGYAKSNINSKDNSGKTDVDSYQGTLYGGYMDSANPYYLNGAFSFAYNTYKGSRHIAVGTIVRTADADYDGQQYSILVDGGYIFNAGKFRVTPIASLQYLRLHLEGYTETGANALNLSVGRENYDMLQSGLGMKLERPFKLKESTIVPEVHAKWLYDFIGDRQETTSTFSGGGGSFATQGFDPAQHSFNVGTKLTLATKWNWSLETNYDFEYKEDFAAHTGWANARYKF